MFVAHEEIFKKIRAAEKSHTRTIHPDPTFPSSESLNPSTRFTENKTQGWPLQSTSSEASTKAVVTSVDGEERDVSLRKESLTLSIALLLYEIFRRAERTNPRVDHSFAPCSRSYEDVGCMGILIAVAQQEEATSLYHDTHAQGRKLRRSLLQ